MTWVIIANTNSCRIFAYETNPKKLTLVEGLTHPDSKLRNVDLVSDGPGKYRSFTHIGSSFDPRETAHQNEINSFAREIASKLNAAKKKEDYKDLILIAQPHMIGLLHQHLDHHVMQCIKDNINKDYTKLSEKELFDKLNKSLPKKRFLK